VTSASPAQLAGLADDLVSAHVRDGQCVVLGALAAQPLHLTAALARQAWQLHELRVCGGMLLDGYTILEPPSVRFASWFPPGTLLRNTTIGASIDYLPMSWSQVNDWLSAGADVDVAMVQVSPADAEGYHSLGVSSSYTAAAVDSARVVLAEVNLQMPTTHGIRLHRSRIAGSLSVSYPLPAFPMTPPTEVDEAIAQLIADLVEDGSCLQIGVGAVPDAALRAVARRGHSSLRIHSTATQGLLDVVDRGALAAGEGSVVVGEVLGDSNLYDFVDQNPVVRMVSGAETHGRAALSALQRFVAINSALSLDLAGQVNTEYLGSTQLGAIGGLADFARAGCSAGNRSIIGLRSTARGGEVSRIVPRLMTPTVSLSRDVADVVVTEHGVADLRGCTTSERAEKLISVAAPRFRAELKRGMLDDR
jgi:4-hydroxybutyrate CoA-transferase